MRAGEINVADGVLLAMHNNRSQALQYKLKPEFTELPFDIVPWRGKD